MPRTTVSSMTETSVASQSSTSSAPSRADGRHHDEHRPIRITRGWTKNGEGSVLVEFGDTRVLCVASFTEGVPRWRKDSGNGWVTAEYAMLPRSTSERSGRESVRGKIGGRTHEISRLIGRSLRTVVNTKKLGENTIIVDCDVLQADGGTRTAAITGAWVALHDAIQWGINKKAVRAKSTTDVLTDNVAAISVGVVKGIPVLDLPYVEDVAAETDMNVVGVGSGELVEVQGTAEKTPFSRSELNQLLDLAQLGIDRLITLQNIAVGKELGATTSSDELNKI